jgi:hypothetical protein
MVPITSLLYFCGPIEEVKQGKTPLACWDYRSLKLQPLEQG